VVIYIGRSLFSWEATYHFQHLRITFLNNIFIARPPYAVGAVPQHGDVKAYNNVVINPFDLPASATIRNTVGVEAKNIFVYSIKSAFPTRHQGTHLSADATSDCVFGKTISSTCRNKTIAKSTYPIDIVNKTHSFGEPRANDFSFARSSRRLTGAWPHQVFNWTADGGPVRRARRRGHLAL